MSGVTAAEERSAAYFNRLREDHGHPNKDRCPNAYTLISRALANYRTASITEYPDDDRAKRCIEVWRTARLALHWGFDIATADLPFFNEALKETPPPTAEEAAPGVPAKRKFRNRRRPSPYKDDRE